MEGEEKGSGWAPKQIEPELCIVFFFLLFSLIESGNLHPADKRKKKAAAAACVRAKAFRGFSGSLDQKKRMKKEGIEFP